MYSALRLVAGLHSHHSCRYAMHWPSNSIAVLNLVVVALVQKVYLERERQRAEALLAANLQEINFVLFDSHYPVEMPLV